MNTARTHKQAHRIAETISRDEFKALLEEHSTATIFIAHHQPRFADYLSINDSIGGVTYYYSTASTSVAKSHYGFAQFTNSGIVFEIGGRTVRLAPIATSDEVKARILASLSSSLPTPTPTPDADEINELLDATLTNLDRLIELAQSDALRIGSDVHFLIDAREVLISASNGEHAS